MDPENKLSIHLDPNFCYSVKELAFKWKLDSETVRRLFIREPGVMIFRNQLPGKRVYRLLRIPGDVAIRVVNRITIPRLDR